MSGFRVPAAGIPADGLTLRLPTPADADLVIEAFADPAIADPLDAPQMSDAELRNFAGGGAADLAAAGIGLALMIEQDGEVLGGCSLWGVDWDASSADLGYWLVGAGRGRGAATKAARALAAFGHESGLQRVQAYVDVDNDASVRVLERAGFTREGTLRSLARRRGGRTDRHLFSLLPGE